MYTYAQIVNGKVNWIFQNALSLAELGQQIYNLNQIQLVDITGTSPEPQAGWLYANGIFSTSVTLLTVDSINAEYLPQFQTLQAAYIAAQLAGNTANQTAIQRAYQALQTQYNQEMSEVITGGGN